MRFIIVIYYLIFILTGGYRHFAFEFEFFASFAEDPVRLDPRYFLSLAESLLVLLAMVILCSPMRKNLHLVFFAALFGLDLFFQNFVKFERSIILTHLFPLLAYFLLRYTGSEREKVIHYGMLVLTVGYFSSFVIKALSGWADYSRLAVYSYVNQFHTGYGIDGLTSSYFLQIRSHFFWKLADYAVILFQGSSIILFFRPRFFKWFSLGAFIFHLLILFCLEITVFYPYLIYYTLLIAGRGAGNPSGLDPARYYGWIPALLLFSGFVVSGGDAHFVMQHLSLGAFEYANVFFTLISSVFFIYYWVKFEARRDDGYL